MVRSIALALGAIVVGTAPPAAAQAARQADPSRPDVYDVRSYGATGDGTTKDTPAIQKAIDACHAAGGGLVLLRPGRYLSGTIFLKSNVQFHLAAGATLVGSPDRADYNADDVFPENWAIPQERASGAHLIICYRQENVALTGFGAIDGNSKAFYAPLPKGATATFRYKSATAGRFDVDWRPAQLVHFALSRRVCVQDVTIVDAPFSNLFLQACDDVQVRGVKMTQPPASHSDGLIVDYSRNVIISDCQISTGDDCICLYTRRPSQLGKAAIACENVVITNCILRTPCNAFRLGVGDGPVRNCTVSNIVIPEARTAISIVARWSERVDHGTTLENVHFSDVVANVCVPFVIDTGPGARRPAAVRDVTFSRFRIRATAGSQLQGRPDLPLERIRFCDIDCEIRGGTDNLAFREKLPRELQKTGYHGEQGTPALPCILYGRHLEDVSLHDMRVRWEGISPVWRDGFCFENCRGVTLGGLHLRQPQDEGGAAVRSRACAGVTVQNCRAALNTGVFLLAEQSPPGERIRCAGNDMTDAREPVVSDVPLMPVRGCCQGPTSP